MGTRRVSAKGPEGSDGGRGVFFKRQSERFSAANECALADETRFSTPPSKGRNEFRIPEGKDGHRAREVFDGGSADKEVMT